MKHLPKHLRPRWRYLAVGIESWPDERIDRRAFQRRVWYAAQNLFGDPGSADLDLSVLQFTYADGSGEALVRTRRGETDRARAALACIAEIDGAPIGLTVRGIGGTVRACEEKYLGRRREGMTERNVVFADVDRSAVERDDALDVRLDDGFVGATELDIK